MRKGLGNFIGFLLFVLILIVLTSISIDNRYRFSSPSSESMETQEQSGSPAFLLEVTAYCSCSRCCGKWADGFTASGHKIKKGDKFAAAPKHIPFGTVLEIPGYGKVPVLDRGGAIKVSKIDVFFDTHQEALNWGVQFLEVKVND